MIMRVTVIMMIGPVIMVVPIMIRLAPRRVLFPSFVETPRLEQVFRGDDRGRVTPRDRHAGKQQRLGKVRLDQIEIVQRGEDRALFPMPTADQVE